MSCEDCDEKVEKVPIDVHQRLMDKQEFYIKKLISLVIITMLLFFATNAIWIFVWNKYDYATLNISQTGEGVNIVGNENEVGKDESGCRNPS